MSCAAGADLVILGCMHISYNQGGLLYLELVRSHTSRCHKLWTNEFQLGALQSVYSPIPCKESLPPPCSPTIRLHHPILQPAPITNSRDPSPHVAFPPNSLFTFSTPFGASASFSSTWLRNVALATFHFGSNNPNYTPPLVLTSDNPTLPSPKYQLRGHTTTHHG